MFLTDSEKLALTQFCADLPTFSASNDWTLEQVKSGIQMYSKSSMSTGCECFWPFSTTESAHQKLTESEVCPKTTEESVVHSICCKTTITAPSDFILRNLTDNSFLTKHDDRITSMMPMRSLSPQSELFYMNLAKPAQTIQSDPRYAIAKRTLYQSLDPSMMCNNLMDLGYFMSDRCDQGVIARGVRRNCLLSEKDNYVPTDDASDLYEACFQNSINGAHCVLFQSVASNFCDEQVAELHARAQDELEEEAVKPMGTALGTIPSEKAEGRILLSQILAPSNAIRAEIYPGTGFFVRDLRPEEGLGSEVFYVMRIALHETGDITNYMNMKALESMRKALNQEWKEHEHDEGVVPMVKVTEGVPEMRHFLASPTGVTPIPSAGEKARNRPGYTYVPPKNPLERMAHEQA